MPTNTTIEQFNQKLIAKNMSFHNIFNTFNPKIQEALKTLGFTNPTEPSAVFIRLFVIFDG